MSRRFLTVLFIGAVVQFSFAFANDDVYLKKGGKVKGVITAETPKGITLKNGDTYPADAIDDVFYEVSAANPVLVSLMYRNAFASEREAADKEGKKRAASLADAMAKYENALGKVQDKRVAAHIKYKLGYLYGRKAIEDGTDPKNAIVRLLEFKKENPQSWQISRALLLLAKLQLDSKDFTGAESTFNEISKLDVADPIKHDAMLQSALANLQIPGRTTSAEQKLADLLKLLPKDSPVLPRALVAQAEVLTNNKKNDEAIAILRKVTKGSTDKNLKAVAYNTLGIGYYNSDQLKEARWEFLWVDVVYNQDKNEHAKALYYLSHIFSKLAEPEKAEECRDLLLTDRAFAGTEFQRRMQKEKGK